MLPPNQLLQEAYRTSQDDSMEMFYPTMLVLHSFLAETPDYQERIRLLQDICKNHVTYLKEFNLPEATVASIYLECESLIHYNEILTKLMSKTKNKILVKDNISDHPLPFLEQYIYIQSLRELGIPYYIAFTEGYAYYLRHQKEKKRPDLSMAILQVKNFIGRIWSENIIEFSKALYCGESMRLHETNQIGDNDLVGLRSFDVAFRNQCFDEYIRIRIKEIAQELQEDNDRLYPVTDVDCLKSLYEREKMAVDRELGFEQFRGSQAYSDHWYKGLPDVLKTAGYFVIYLSDKINALNNTTQQPVRITHVYHDNAQHIDHSRNIHIDGSNIDMDKFLGDFLKDNVSMTQQIKKEKTTKNGQTLQEVRKRKKPVANANFMTFQTNGITKGHVTLLYQHLMNIGWIPKNTPADDFQKLFSGKVCVCKITWTGGGKGNLRELFRIMREQQLITIPGNNGLEPVLESHFVDKEGNYLTGLNSSGNGARKSLPIIDECIRILQTSPDFGD